MLQQEQGADFGTMNDGANRPPLPWPMIGVPHTLDVDKQQRWEVW